MSLSSAAVAAASAAWVWVPDNAEVIETDQYTILRLPDYFERDLRVLTFMPDGPLGPAVDAVLGRARTLGRPELDWEARLEAPAGLAAELAARGGQPKLTVEVLATDLSAGAPELPPPTAKLTVRWATDAAATRDGAVVGVAAFGGAVAPDERIEAEAERDARSVPAGDGGMVVAYLDGTPVGCGGVTMADGVARLWGGAVVPGARGQGVYRAVLAERLRYAVTHGATMALVKGNVETSGPILRKAGFAGHGQETVYTIPLG